MHYCTLQLVPQLEHFSVQFSYGSNAVGTSLNRYLEVKVNVVPVHTVPNCTVYCSFASMTVSNSSLSTKHVSLLDLLVYIMPEHEY